MSGLLRGKIVAVTGSSSGIGRATAFACARQGARLFLHHFDNETSRQDIESLQDQLQKIDPELQHTTFGADITLESSPRALMAQVASDHGRLDVFVNNAGICTFSDYQNVTRQLLERHMTVNFNASFLLAQAAAAQMSSQERPGGSIVNIASITATMGSAQLTHYSASKAALLGMTVSCTAAMGPVGIRYNCVSPGTIETSMNKEDLDRDGKRKVMADKVPLRRLGKPEDVADAVVFFASDLSRYITGQNLLVDGGVSINYQ